MASSCQACEETPAPAAPSRRVNGWRVCLRAVESTRPLLAHLLAFTDDHHAGVERAGSDLGDILI